MTAPEEHQGHESLWETFNSKPGTYLVGGLALFAVGVATGGRTLGGVARAGASALLSQGANLLMDNRKHDDPRAGAATWMGVSLAGNFALNMMKPEKALVDRVLPALAEAQISTSTGFAVKAVNAGVDSVAAKLGFGALVGAIGGATSSAATMRPDSLEDAVGALGSAALTKAGQRVATTGVQELGKRIGDLRQPGPDTPAPWLSQAPVQRKEPPGPTMR